MYDVLSYMMVYGSGSQTVCRGKLVCRENYLDVPQNFNEIEIF